MTEDDQKNRVDSPLKTPTYNRRHILRGATFASAGLFGLATLRFVPGGAHGPANALADGISDKDAVHDTMRKLWEDHIVWTRCFIVSFAAGSGNLNATTDRLLHNQVDIGDAFRPFVGDAAGDQLTSLLTDHILGAATLLNAAKAGDTSGVQAASDAWYANAKEIATFVSNLDPREWPLAEMQHMMRDHLDLTLAEGVAELQGNWAAGVAAYDQVHAEILQMADMLSAGLVKRWHLNQSE